MRRSSSSCLGRAGLTLVGATLWSAALAVPSDAIQAGPWRVPIAGDFAESRDDRGLVLTAKTGERVIVRSLTSERPRERGEAARRRIDTAAALEREWFVAADREGEVIRRTFQVRQLTGGRTVASLATERQSAGRYVLRYSVFDSVNRVDLVIDGDGRADAAVVRFDPLIEATRSVGPTTFK